MTIDPTAELTLGTIDMHPLEILEADDPLKFGKGLAAGLLGTQIISGGKGMTGIEADPDPTLVLDAINDLGQMLE